jgi:hypothetical protein
MRREELLQGFEKTHYSLETADQALEESIKNKLLGLLTDRKPNYTGVKEASWVMRSGVQVNVRASTQLDQDPLNPHDGYLATKYEITFHRDTSESQTRPGEERYAELYYELAFPAPGTIDISSTWRSYIEVDRAQENVLNETHASMDSLEFESAFDIIMARIAANSLDEYDEDEEAESHKVTIEDLIMLAMVLQNPHKFNGDPILIYIKGELNGDAAGKGSSNLLESLLEGIVGRGTTHYSRKVTLPLHFDDPSSTGKVHIYMDVSEHGTLSVLDNTSVRPLWMVTIEIASQNDPIIHKLQLIKQFDGNLRCTDPMDMSNEDQMQLLDSGILPKIYDLKKIHSDALRKVVGLDGANQKQLLFFDRVLADLS